MARPNRGRHRRGQPRAGLSIPFGEVSCRIEMLVERPRHFQPGPCRGTRIQPDPPHGSPDLRVRSLGDRPQKTDSMGRRATWIGQRSRTSADTTRLRPDQLSSLRRKTAGHHASTCPPELLLPPPRSGIMPASVLLDGARCGVSPPTGGTRRDCGETTYMNGIRIAGTSAGRRCCFPWMSVDSATRITRVRAFAKAPLEIERCESTAGNR